MATWESSIETTNHLRWYGTWPIMVFAFSKYAQTINGKQSKLNSLVIEAGSMFACLIWSNGILAGMMWLTTNSCQQNILSHGFKSQIDGFGAMFNIEHWWAINEVCTCSLSWSRVPSYLRSVLPNVMKVPSIQLQLLYYQSLLPVHHMFN
jgi:hypothetical protein